MSLREDYKDDIFSGNRKYRMIDNGDGTVSFTDVTTYAQTGDTYGAAEINEANTVINELDQHSYRINDPISNISNMDYIPYIHTSGRFKANWASVVNGLKEVLAIKDHKSSTAATYGAGNNNYYGHVKLSDNYITSAGTASDSVGASSYALAQAYNNRAPVDHASSTTAYGVGSTSKFGHLKINDSYQTSSGNAASGVAASGKAVNDAYKELVEELTGGLNTGNAARFYMDYQNKYGINTSAGRGASTFYPLLQYTPMNVSSSITKNTSYITSDSSVAVVISGNIVTVDLYIHMTASATGQYTNYNIASKLPAPTVELRNLGASTIDDVSTSVGFWIKSNGDLNIYIRNQAVAGATIQCSFCYPCVI